VLRGLKRVLKSRSSDAPRIEVVYTDNVKRDKPAIKKLFKKYAPHHKVTHVNVLVLNYS